MIYEKLRWEIRFLWQRARGLSVRGIIEAEDMPVVDSYNWPMRIFRFVYLMMTRVWYLLPGIWVLIRYGRFMFLLWWEWTDFEGRPLPSWAMIKQKARNARPRVLAGYSPSTADGDICY
jgi:hypothetical protein